MVIAAVIKHPTYSQAPDFITSEHEVQLFTFGCTYCNATLTIDLKEQIKASWIGRTSKISDVQVAELKEYYGIGIVNKSHSGGMPVFDRITCANCISEYMFYCDVQEFRNSAYTVQVQGILKVATDH